MSGKDKPVYLIIGGDSSIGNALSIYLEAQSYKYFYSTRRKSISRTNSVFIDLSDPSTFSCLTQFSQKMVVIFCSAITSIAQCEENAEYTKTINVTNTINMIDRLSELGHFIIFLSTNLVFNGIDKSPTPYSPKKPTTNYGYYKSIVEDYLLSNVESSVILRLSKVLDNHDPLFTTWAKSLSINEPITPYSNKLFAPVSTMAALKAIVSISPVKSKRIYQLSAFKDISYYDAALEFAKSLLVDTNLVHASLLINNTNRQPADLRYASMEVSSHFQNASVIQDPYSVIRDLALSIHNRLSF